MNTIEGLSKKTKTDTTNKKQMGQERKYKKLKEKRDKIIMNSRKLKQEINKLNQEQKRNEEITKT